MKVFLLKTVLLVFFMFSHMEGDIIEEIASHFQTGKTKEISEHFASTINFSILNDSNVYSKVQAEIILNRFLTTHEPRAAKIIHRLNNSTTYKHAVIELATNQGKFRVSYSIRVDNNTAQIVELRIEKAIE
ncbi:DUF4783 domain-containing protein [Albibacterium profundi]|uniref:DUF4783 domain-containing protein n=1 Tax=Albibacterium profundi TaxID=3134906 RepID=A0ABV5CB03_9SPHI